MTKTINLWLASVLSFIVVFITYSLGAEGLSAMFIIIGLVLLMGAIIASVNDIIQSSSYNNRRR